MKMMKMVLFAIIMLTTISIRPSLAQDDEVENAGCWLKISSCLGDNDVALCCPIIQQEIDDERDCFCLMKETALQNATIDASFSTIFTFCDISGSFQTLCPDDSDSSSAPLVSPDSSSSSGSIPTSAPVEDPSPPSPTSTTSTPATDVSTPSPDESLPAGVGECWSKILTCTDSKSESEISECCPIVEQAVTDESECFCAGAKIAVLDDPSNADTFDQYLTLCKISESLDTLCPSSNSSTTGSRIPKKTKNSLNISGSNNNNIAHIVGLLPSSLLIIFAITFLI
ncbi:uncharacterized protein LOC110692896 [Chenopodium quinoa]|uniref:Bifunctional inhibitor/plant lipid transfer protein/seed storage helical domain-containing protein n=1 Tax=Chenopodium quinoa TaxID=63459 RepID=A0A803MCT0_CHEQI|nr:uncharacterized protein LOC110692896 [Chenopodium quinoa]